MKKLRNRDVTKLTVGDLKKELKGVPNDTEIVLGFYMKEDGVHYAYLGDIWTNMKFDGVKKDKLFEGFIVELVGYSDKFCTYREKIDE